MKADLQKDIEHFEGRLRRHKAAAERGVENGDTIRYEERALEDLKDKLV